jgi:hypothetical protein
MTNAHDKNRWKEAMELLGNCLGAEIDNIDTPPSYFGKVAEDIRIREQRSFQKQGDEKVFHLDIISDYAIPVITRFIADWLGFWDRVKTVKYPNREFSENAIYELLYNCQDYQSWDADQTKVMKR